MKHTKLLLKIMQHLHRKKEIRTESYLLIGVLGLGGILLIGFSIYWAWSTYTNQSVSTLLPQEKTIVFLEVKDSTLPTKLHENKAIAALLNIENITGLFGKEEGNIPEWIKGDKGIALLKGGSKEAHSVFFFRSPGRKQALSSFKTIGLTEEPLQKDKETKQFIYSYPEGQNLFLSFIGPYLFVANNREDLMAIQDTYKGTIPSLNDDKSYQKAFGNLPKNVWARGYINIAALQFKEGQPVNAILKPIQEFATQFSWTIRKHANGFHFNTFLGVNPEFLSLNHKSKTKNIFNFGLSEYLNADQLAFYLGGADLSAEWQNTLETISEMNPAYGIILEGMVRAKVEKIFGNGISLRNDIYPLLEGEYALSLSSRNDETIGVQVLLKHNDRDFVGIKLDKLRKGFGLLAAQFSPKVKVVILPDGTESRELVADPDRLIETKEEYEGYQINCTEVEESTYGFCYTVTDELMIIGNHIGNIKKTLDATKSSDFVLSGYQPFRETLSHLSKVKDEMAFIGFGQLIPLLQKMPFASLAIPYLESLDAVTWVKHYFDDGVSAEGFVLIK